MKRPVIEQRGLAFSKTIQDKFEEFHEANPWVMDELVAKARELQLLGIERYGIKALFEVLRWEHAKKRVSRNTEFALNNVFTSRYARLIEAEHEDLRGFFSTRELKAA